ncbi:MAG: hypothetical protein HPY53_08255 [Brevinematales bacterium]|nr:hypothetical protein [Brevinematales bacterium]
MKRMVWVLFAYFLLSMGCSVQTPDGSTGDNTETIPPVFTITSPTNGQKVGGSYQITGTVSDSGGSGVEKVYIRTDGGEFTGVIPVNGIWTANISVSNDGIHSNTVYARDNAGNMSGEASVWVERDIIPFVTIDSPANGSTVNVSNVTITGTAGVDSPVNVLAVQLCLNSGTWINASGTVSWTNILMLDEGTNTISARVIADNGKTNFSAGWTIVFIMPEPAITISLPANGTKCLTPQIKFTGTAGIDAPYSIEKVQVMLNAGGWADASGALSWSNTFTLAEGTNSVYARVIADNNRTNTTPVWKIIKVSAPVINVTTPTNGTFLKNPEITISGTSSVLAPYSVVKVQYRMNAGVWTNVSGTVSWTAPVYLPIGTNTFSFRAITDSGVTNTLDNWLIIKDNKFTACDGVANDEYGIYISVSGDGSAFAVGSHKDDDKGADSGSVYLYSKSGSVWLTNKFIASDGAAGDLFGIVSLSADGTILAVGSQRDDDKGADSGSVYLFTKSGSVWLTNKFVALDGAASDWFGRAVSLSADGTVMVVGSRKDDDKGTDSGSAYLFTKSGSVWLTNKFVPLDGAADDLFGYSVSVSADGNAFAVSAWQDDDKGTNSGSVYLFTKSGSVWLTNKFVPNNQFAYQRFGESVSVSADGTSLIVGAWNDQDKGDGSGAVYLFTKSGSDWITNKFYAFDEAAYDCFGTSVSISADGNKIAASSTGDDSKGSVYLFIKSGSDWLTNKYIAYDGAVNDYFGASVSLSGDGGTVVVGSYGDDDMGSISGSVYVFPW